MRLFKLSSRSELSRRLLVLLVVAPLLFSAVQATYSVYLSRIVHPQRTERARFVSDIVSGRADSPYRYRILIPVLTRWFGNQCGRLSGEADQACFEKADRFMTYLSFLATGLALLFLLSLVLSGLPAVIGTLIGFYVVSQTFQDHFYQPWSYLEPAFLAIALVAVIKRKPILFASIATVAVLNRETGVLLPLLLVPEFLSGSLQARRFWLPGLVAPILCFVSIRLWLGHAPHVHTVTWILHRNLATAGQAAERWVTFLGVYWLPFILGLVSAAKRRSRMLPLAGAYVASVLIFGIWMETRMLVGLLPILVLLILEPLSEPIHDGREQPSGSVFQRAASCVL